MLLGYARDSTGKWQVIVQTESLPQRVAIDLCHNPEKPCKLTFYSHENKSIKKNYNNEHKLHS